MILPEDITMIELEEQPNVTVVQWTPLTHTLEEQGILDSSCYSFIGSVDRFEAYVAARPTTHFYIFKVDKVGNDVRFRYATRD